MSYKEMQGHFAIHYLFMTFFSENELIFHDLEPCIEEVNLVPLNSPTALPLFLATPISRPLKYSFMSCCLRTSMLVLKTILKDFYLV